LIDQNGYLFVVDRIKELIKVKGYQVAPAELEAVLLAHPDVTDAAVTAVEADGDQRPVAFIVSASDPDPDAIGEWVAERVAPYKRLERVIVRQSLPRNGNGKILRRQLAATATQEAR
jgi:acyl-coenzyme A synthetase/AMP-(fatty) acid ligase